MQSTKPIRRSSANELHAARRTRRALRARNRYSPVVLAAPGLALCAFASGCSSAPAGKSPGATNNQADRAGRTASALNLDNLPSVGQLACDAFNQIPDNQKIGFVTINKSPQCSYTTYDNLYYLGEDDSGSASGNAPSTRAGSMGDALYCALKGSNAAQADATSSGAFGRFGMAARVNVSKYDPATFSQLGNPERQVVGQRLGTLYAFGAGLDIENQDFVATFDQEPNVPGCNVRGAFCDGFSTATGYYMDMKSSAVRWGLGGSGRIPLGTSGFELTLGADVGQNGTFEALNNNAFALTAVNTDISGNTGADQLNSPTNSALTWDTFVAQHVPCAPNDLFCPPPISGDEFAQHDDFVSFTPDQYRNLGDGILPYGGNLGGISGQFVYRPSSMNWTQFGPAQGGETSIVGNPPAGAAPPTHNVSNNPSSHLGFAFGLTYAKLISVSVGLDLKFLSAMQLSQGQGTISDGPQFASVTTSLDAASSVSLGADLAINNPFGFGPDPLFKAHFNLIDPQTPGVHVQAADVRYDYSQGTPFYSFQTSNGDADLQSCLAAPATDNPVATVSTPDTFMQQVVDTAPNYMYPCQVRYCDFSQPDPAGGFQLMDCSWDAPSGQMICAPLGVTCVDMCQNSAAICDSSGVPHFAASGRVDVGLGSQACGPK